MGKEPGLDAGRWGEGVLIMGKMYRSVVQLATPECVQGLGCQLHNPNGIENIKVFACVIFPECANIFLEMSQMCSIKQ